jgi:hypothetical protein
MAAMAHPASDAKRLAHYRAQLKQLAAQVADVGFITPGSLVQRYTTCGNPDCRCAAHPPELHGPYWHWSKAVAGKTINRTVTEEQVPLYQEWIANRRRLRQIVTEIEKISEQATQILLQQASERLDRTAPTNNKP